MKDSLNRIAESKRSRGHATWFHWPREHKHRAEVDNVCDWAETMHSQHGWDVRNIEKNSQDYPDCLAEMRHSEGNEPELIGIEVTELVDSEAITAHRDEQHRAKAGKLDQNSDAELLELRRRMNPEWPFEKFKARLSDLVSDKDIRSRDHSLQKQFLLIVTDEPNLDQDLIRKHLSAFALPRPRTFDAVFLMISYMPRIGHEGHYPVFEVALTDA